MEKGERYFASKLLDYEASSNIGSWQWAASTGADAVPYFRIFNPYLQSAKFDKDAIFIKSVIPELKDINSKLIHSENGVQSNIFLNYPPQLVSIEFSRKELLKSLKEQTMKNIDIAIIGSGMGGRCLHHLTKIKKYCCFEKDMNLGGCASTLKRFGNYFNTGATTFVGYEDNHILKRFLIKLM